jgi:putative hemolysin
MITLEIVAVTLLILLNGVLAMSEMAIVSSRRPRLRHMAANGSLGAQKVLQLLDEPVDFLAAIQIGITLVSVFAGAFGGATLASRLSVYIAQIESLSAYSDGLALGIVVASITYLSLVIGELAPKSFAMAYPEEIAVIVVRPISFVVRFARPVVRVLTWSTRMALRFVGFRGATRRTVTEEEVKLLIEEGTHSGALDPSEEAMMKRIMRTGDRNVGDVMTPRTQIQAINIRDSSEDNFDRIRSSHHAFLPVYDDSIDKIIGMASVKELFNQQPFSGQFDLPSGWNEALFVPKSMPAFRALEEFKRTGKHIAVVVDEYGGTTGLLTIMDILEAIVGDVPDEKELDHPDILQRHDGSWLVGGMVSIDDFKEALEIKEIANEEKGNFQSVGGLVLHHLGRIPTEGDEFDAVGHHFEVVDMDGRRIDKVLITKCQDKPVPDDLGTFE